MSSWKASLPRVMPPVGKVSTVIAIKTARGFRTELVGDLPERQALAAFNLANFKREDFEKLAPELVKLGVLAE